MLAEFRAALEAQDRSTTTIKGYMADLTLFARWFEETNGESLMPQNLTPTDIKKYRRYLESGGKKPATIHRHLSAIQSYGRWAQEEGFIDFNPSVNIRKIAQVQLAPKWLDRKQQSALERELERQVQIASQSPRRFYALRDRAIVLLLLNTGLRISELSTLQMDHLTLTERKGALRVKGKGSKERLVPINRNARAALTAWLEIRPADKSERLFITDDGQPIKTRTVQAMLTVVGKKAGIDPLTPHMLRHTFAKSLVDNSVSLDRVATLLGHSSLNTTRRYTTPSIGDLEAAVELLDD